MQGFLVTFGYLLQLPKDITGSPATWVVDYSELPLDLEGRPGIEQAKGLAAQLKGKRNGSS